MSSSLSKDLRGKHSVSWEIYLGGRREGRGETGSSWSAELDAAGSPWSGVEGWECVGS